MRRIATILLPALLSIGVAAPARAGGMDALAITEAAATLPPNQFVWTPAADGPGRVSVLISIPADKAYGTQEEVDADGSGSPAGDLLFVADILGATESAEQPEAPATGDATDGAEDSATADDQASAEG